jgi:hypothetical protein
MISAAALMVRAVAAVAPIEGSNAVNSVSAESATNIPFIIPPDA